VAPEPAENEEKVTQLDSLRLALAIVGGVLGYGSGRLLWQMRGILLPPWPIIAVVAVLGLISLRLFTAVGWEPVWQATFFPLLVGWGAGLSITAARPQDRAAWWQVWKQ
jgi:hypothetical protein